jgi:hypothetical protein
MTPIDLHTPAQALLTDLATLAQAGETDLRVCFNHIAKDKTDICSQNIHPQGMLAITPRITDLKNALESIPFLDTLELSIQMTNEGVFEFQTDVESMEDDVLEAPDFLQALADGLAKAEKMTTPDTPLETYKVEATSRGDEFQGLISATNVDQAQYIFTLMVDPRLPGDACPITLRGASKL